MTRSGSPSCQPWGHSGSGGRSAGVPFRQLSLQPILEQIQFPDGEPPVPDEAALSRLGQPGRHVAGAGDHLDLSRPRLDILVGEEAEGGHLSRTVAGSAALVDDGGDVPVEGDGAGGFLSGFRGSAGSEENRQDEPDQKDRKTGGCGVSVNTAAPHVHGSVYYQVVVGFRRGVLSGAQGGASFRAPTGTGVFPGACSGIVEGKSVKGGLPSPLTPPASATRMSPLPAPGRTPLPPLPGVSLFQVQPDHGDEAQDAQE